MFLDAASSLGVSPKVGIGALKVRSSPLYLSLLSLSSPAASSKLSLLSSEGDPGEGAPPRILVELQASLLRHTQHLVLDRHDRQGDEW